MYPQRQGPGQRALRKGRASIPGQVYLVTTVVRDRRPVFANWDWASEAARIAENPQVLGPGRFLAWVIMPDHFHGLLQLSADASLDQVMKRFKGNIACRVNRLADRRGSLWQSGYHDHALRKEEDLRAVARYLVGNPLRAGLVARIGDYPFWNAVWL
jgi:putative transposase